MATPTPLTIAICVILFLAVFLLGLFAGANLEPTPPRRIKVTAMPQSTITRSPRPAALNPTNPFYRQCARLEIEIERLTRQLSDARAETSHARAEAREDAAQQLERDMAEHAARVDKEQRKADSAWEAKLERMKLRAEGIEGKISHYRMMAKMAETAKGMAEESKEKVWNEVTMKEDELKQVKKDVEEKVREAVRKAHAGMRKEVKRAQTELAAAQEEKQKLSKENEKLKAGLASCQSSYAEAEKKVEEEQKKLSDENENLKAANAAWQAWYVEHGAEVETAKNEQKKLSDENEGLKASNASWQAWYAAHGAEAEKEVKQQPEPASPTVEEPSMSNPQDEAKVTEQTSSESTKQELTESESKPDFAEEDLDEPTSPDDGTLPLLASPESEESSHEAGPQEEATATEQRSSNSSNPDVVEEQSEEGVAGEDCGEQNALPEEFPPLPEVSEQEQNELSSSTPSEEFPPLPAASEQEEHDLSELSTEAIGDQANDAKEVASSPPPAEERDLVPESPKSVNEELYLALDEAARSPPRTADQYEVEEIEEPTRAEYEDADADEDLDEVAEPRYSPPPPAEQHVLIEEATKIEDAPMADEADVQDPTAMDTDEPTVDIAHHDEDAMEDAMEFLKLDNDEMMVDPFVGIYDQAPEDSDMANAGAPEDTFDCMDAEDDLYRPSPPSSPGLYRVLQAVDSPQDYMKSLGLDQDMDDVAGHDDAAQPASNDQQMEEAPDLAQGNTQLVELSPELKQYLDSQNQAQSNPPPQAVGTGLMQYLGTHIHDPQKGWQAAPAASQDTDMDANYALEWEDVDFGSSPEPAITHPNIPSDALTITVPSTDQGYFRPAAPPMPLFSQGTSSQPTATLPGLFLKSQSTAKESPNSIFKPVPALQQPVTITRPCQHCLGSTTKHSNWCIVIVSRPIFGARHDPLCEYCLKRQSSHPGMKCPVKKLMNNDSFNPKGFVAEEDCHEQDCFAFKGDCHDFTCTVGQEEQIFLLKGKSNDKWINTGVKEETAQPLQLETTATLSMLDSHQEAGKRQAEADNNPYKRQKAVIEEEAAAPAPAPAVVKPKPKAKEFKNNNVFFTPKRKPAVRKAAAAPAALVKDADEMEE